MKRSRQGLIHNIVAIKNTQHLEITGKTTIMLIQGTAHITNVSLTPYVKYTTDFELNTILLTTIGTVPYDQLSTILQQNIPPMDDIGAVLYIKAPHEKRKIITIPENWANIDIKSNVC